MIYMQFDESYADYDKMHVKSEGKKGDKTRAQMLYEKNRITNNLYTLILSFL